MSNDLSLGDTSHKTVSPISWIIFIGYILLAGATFVLIRYVDFARDIFDQTQLMVLINAVWFSFGIVGYGIYALVKNHKRAKLSNLRIKLDTQFLIVMAFILFAIKQVLDLIMYLQNDSSSLLLNAVENTGKVLEFGGFMAGLASIYFGRKNAQ